MIKIKKLHPEAQLPKYMRSGDAALDLYSIETKIIPPNQRVLIATGIAMAIPKGYAGLIWDKSGMAANHGIKSMGGVIDSNYRGEIKIILHNLSEVPFTVEKNTRIAQMLIQPVEEREVIEVAEFEEETPRGKEGFGSTGKD